MSRALKFRAWHLDKKEMLFWKWGNFTWKAEGGIPFPWPNAYGEPISEPMQFTGLQDKNRKEIYEGDRVRFSYEDDLSCIDCEATVEWCDDGYWQVMIEDRGFLTAIFSEKIDGIEIIGNIYENPALLERKEGQ